MPTGYRLEIASRSQASCNGRKPCKGSKIEKGTLRLGTWVEIQGHGAFKWRHWGCTTPEVIGHLKRDFEKPSDVDGFEELPEMYQEKFIKAWEVEHVEDEDIPATARLPTPPPGEEGEAETPKKKTPKKAKQPADGEADGDKPKKPRKVSFP
ncbi:hypothetical protein BCR39DRAFT_546121 [Naematelia encephala]|uniref:PARP-type domain-containing protein n=1 Tax=Naematelia encephala TaxID=71784 RepID=A0A1Y2ART6_9TREE|nr:hypothetical protein BCR39DRAFT_546121 [Naematelia encephala]